MGDLEANVNKDNLPIWKVAVFPNTHADILPQLGCSFCCKLGLIETSTSLTLIRPRRLFKLHQGQLPWSTRTELANRGQRIGQHKTACDGSQKVLLTPVRPPGHQTAQRGPPLSATLQAHARCGQDSHASPGSQPPLSPWSVSHRAEDKGSTLSSCHLRTRPPLTWALPLTCARPLSPTSPGRLARSSVDPGRARSGHFDKPS